MQNNIEDNIFKENSLKFLKEIIKVEKNLDSKDTDSLPDLLILETKYSSEKLSIF